MNAAVFINAIGHQSRPRCSPTLLIVDIRFLKIKRHNCLTKQWDTTATADAQIRQVYRKTPVGRRGSRLLHAQTDRQCQTDKNIQTNMALKISKQGENTTCITYSSDWIQLCCLYLQLKTWSQGLPTK